MLSIVPLCKSMINLKDMKTSVHQYISTSVHQYISTSVHQYISTSVHQYISTLVGIIAEFICCENY